MKFGENVAITVCCQMSDVFDNDEVKIGGAGGNELAQVPVTSKA